MSGTPYRNIGRVVKARGLEGKVLVQITEGLPFCIYEGLEVHVVPPVLNVARCGLIADISQDTEDSCIAAIAGIDDIDAAQAISGHCLLAHEDDLDLDPSQDMVLVMGRSVESDDGRVLGRVSEYLCTKANDVLVIERADGSELLVPVLPHTIVSVPQSDDEPIVVHLLEGLEDL